MIDYLNLIKLNCEANSCHRNWRPHGTSARTLRRNLNNFGEEVQIDPVEIRNIRHKVARIRAGITFEKLDQFKMDDSFGALNRYSKAKLSKALLEQHNDEASDFHFKLFEPFGIGQDLKAKNDIVYLNFSTLWHLLYFLRNIAAAWLMEIFGDATYKVCRRGVAIYSIGVNSIPHVNNPVCFAVIPEYESKQMIQRTWRAAQAAAIMIMKQYQVCENDDCQTNRCVAQLMAMPHVQHYMQKPQLEENKMEVLVALSDGSKGWTSFSHEEFGFEPNMCTLDRHTGVNILPIEILQVS